MKYIMICVREMIINPEFASYLERNDAETFRRLLNHVEEANEQLETMAEIIWGCWTVDNALAWTEEWE